MRIVILPIILLLFALPVFAAPPLTFEEVDTDGDGLISADEAASVEGLDFNAADSDNDGTLSVDEYDIAMEKLSQSASPASTQLESPAQPSAAAPAPPARPSATVTPTPSSSSTASPPSPLSPKP